MESDVCVFAIGRTHNHTLLLAFELMRVIFNIAPYVYVVEENANYNRNKVTQRRIRSIGVQIEAYIGRPT